MDIRNYNCTANTQIRDNTEKLGPAHIGRRREEHRRELYAHQRTLMKKIFYDTAKVRLSSVRWNAAASVDTSLVTRISLHYTNHLRMLAPLAATCSSVLFNIAGRNSCVQNIKIYILFHKSEYQKSTL